MKQILYKSFLIASVSLFTFSCFETDDGDIYEDIILDPTVECNVEGYIDSYLSAVETFNAYPTSSNCVILKNRAMDMLNAIHNCDFYEDTEYWEDAVAAWNNINCSDLD